MRLTQHLSTQQQKLEPPSELDHPLDLDSNRGQAVRLSSPLRLRPRASLRASVWRAA